MSASICDTMWYDCSFFSSSFLPFTTNLFYCRHHPMSCHRSLRQFCLLQVAVKEALQNIPGRTPATTRSFKSEYSDSSLKRYLRRLPMFPQWHNDGVPRLTQQRVLCRIPTCFLTPSRILLNVCQIWFNFTLVLYSFSGVNPPVKRMFDLFYLGHIVRQFYQFLSRVPPRQNNFQMIRSVF